MQISLENHMVRVAKSGKLLLSNLNLTLEGGTCYCIVGASGVGKTSLLLSMTRRGSLRRSDGSWQRATYLTPRESVSAEQMTPRRLLGLLGASNELKGWGLAHVADQDASSLSLGEKARLSLAVANVLDPEVLLLDEPNVGLDDNGDYRLQEMIAQRMKSGRITIASTHDLTALEVEKCRILYLTRDDEGSVALNDHGRLLTGKAELMIDELGSKTLTGPVIQIARSLLQLQSEHLR